MLLATNKLITRIFKIAFLLLVLLCLQQIARAQDDYDKARERYTTQLTGGNDIDLTDPYIARTVKEIGEKAFNIDKKINHNLDNGVFTDITEFNEANLLTSYTRLKDMALAWATVGSQAHHNQDLKSDILTAMDWLAANWYSTNRPMPRTPAFDKLPNANWFTWNIAAPQSLDACMVLMYPALSKEQIAAYCASIDYYNPNIAEYTGANLAWVAQVILLRGLVAKDAAKVANGLLGMNKAMAYVKMPIEGFYPDGSHTAHKSVPYTGGYGPAQFHNCISVTDMLSVTSTLKVTGANAQNVYRWAFDSFKPVIYKGGVMPMVMGRYAGRVGSHNEGAGIMQAILFLSQSAPDSNAGMGVNFKGEAYPANPKLAMQQLLKYWFAADNVEDHTPTGIFYYKMYKEFLAKNIQPAAEPIGHFRFPAMDRVVHLRPGYGFGLSMFSTHLKNFETLNEFNKGWHVSDGMTYIFNNDLTQYDDNFWPTVDSYRLPGTTVAQHTTEEKDTKSDQDWVGGCDLGANGIAGMSLHVGELKALKSWFMFDDVIVALGAGITSTGKEPIETIVENRKLDEKNDNLFNVNGTKQANTYKINTLADVNWAHLSGNVPGADMGYYFYSPAQVNYARESRKGAWSDVSIHRSKETVSNNYLTLWFDHKTQPVDSTYAYAVLPGKSVVEMKAYSASPSTTVLANSKNVQAVWDMAGNIVGANFWTNTTQSVFIAKQPFITCNSAASVMTRQANGQIEIAVTDPTQANTGNMIVEINRVGANVIKKDPSITVIQTSPTIKISVAANQTLGASQHITLSIISR
jgi:hyaluronate lyase